jgi:hypothetical protein
MQPENASGTMKLEIWLTDLVIEPQVTIADNTLRIHLNANQNFGEVLASNDDRIPAVLADHFVKMWEGECPERTFRIIDSSTVVISSE